MSAIAARSAPFFSICIPQYNRTSHLIAACTSFLDQTFEDFEVCISDDCSTDGREADLRAFLDQSGLRYVYSRQPENLRYDGNLRAAIALASGHFCLLLGNDDALATPTTLANLHADLALRGDVGVAIANYREYDNSRTYARMTQTGVVGSGPVVAIQTFRNFSFISGIVIDRHEAQSLSTNRWDGSEMYQMYLGCRIIAHGKQLFAVDRVEILKDIRIPGEAVESYASKLKIVDKRIVERQLPLTMLGRVVTDAVGPALLKEDHHRLVTRIFLQILVFTYPYWIVEYRRVHSWQYALGVGLGMRPRYLLQGIDVRARNRLLITCVYLLSTAAGLIIPEPLFRRLQNRLYAVAKKFR